MTAYKLKAIQRTGWVENKIMQPETIASHLFGISFLAMQFAKICHVDELKVIKMSLIHDLQESVVGDFTPTHNISKEKKFELELQAATNLSLDFSNPEILALFKEFEENITNEAKFVHDCDKLDMLLQAYFYENEQNVDLQQFFTSCKLPVSFQPLIDVRHDVEELRNANKSQHQNDSSK